MRARHGMDVALMETVGRCELAPKSHWIADIVTWNIGAGLRGNNAVPLHPEPIGPGTLVLFFFVNRESPSWRRLGRNTNGARDRHQAAVTFHDVNVLFRERNFYAHLRWIIRFVGSDVIRAAAGKWSGCATA